MLRTLFNSDFFKEAMFQKVKSPVEVVVGTLRLTGDLPEMDPRLELTAQEPGYMGQDILNPPSVEGWDTGKKWINSGSLLKRISFVAERVGNAELPGVQRMIGRIASKGTAMPPEALVDECLDLMGPLEVTEPTRKELVAHAQNSTSASWTTGEDYASFSQRVAEMLALIASTREYQFG